MPEAQPEPARAPEPVYDAITGYYQLPTGQWRKKIELQDLARPEHETAIAICPNCQHLSSVHGSGSIYARCFELVGGNMCACDGFRDPESMTPIKESITK